MLNKANLAKVRRRESSGPSETLIRPEELSAFSLPQDAAKLSKLILKKIGGGGGLPPVYKNQSCLGLCLCLAKRRVQTDKQLLLADFGDVVLCCLQLSAGDSNKSLRI